MINNITDEERQALENDIPSYVYYFTKNNGRLGSWHSGEEIYFYGNLPESSRLFDGSDYALSDTAQQYYVNFIRTGDPNGEGLPEWPRSEGNHQVLELGDEVALRAEPFQELHRILDEMYEKR
jgi:para-nitrobenzyl esterase